MPHSPDQPPLTFHTVAIQLAIIATLVLINGFFVAAEFALVSVRKTRIDQLASEGSVSAVVLQRALRDLERQIGAAQVGITVVSLLLGSTGEKYLEPMFLHLLRLVQVPEALMGVSRVLLALCLAYFVMTSLHVIIGEQLPKIVAIQKAEQTALLIVRPMMAITWLFTPLVAILTRSVNFLLARLGLHAVDEHGQVHSPEELNLLFQESHKGGELSATEVEMLHRVVKFSEISARAAMVPRVEMGALPLEMTREELTAYLHGQPHTRVPVFHGTLDEVIGIVHLRDLVRFEAALGEKSDGVEAKINLMPIVREATRVPETITIDKLLTEFKRLRQQMAIVIDEYGGTSGLVTMGDLLQQVFGDMPDEFDTEAPEIEARGDGWIRLHGRVLIDEINDRHALGLNADNADTMAGLVLNELGRPAVVGDQVEINGATLRVEEIDRLRITSLLLQLPLGRNEEVQVD